MKKIFHIAMILLVMVTSNLVSFEKASASTIAGTKGEAVYVGIVTGATAIVTAGMHAQQWYEEKKDEIVEMAYNSWEYMSTDGKEAFLSGVDAYQNGWTVSADLLQNWFDSLSVAYPTVVLDGTERTDLNNLLSAGVIGGSTSSISISFKNYTDYAFILNGQKVNLYVTTSQKVVDGVNKYAFVSNNDYLLTDYTYDWSQVSGVIIKIDSAIRERNNPYDVFSAFHQLFGSMPLSMTYKGELVGQLELDGIDFANGWASNLLNQSESNATSKPFYVEPTLALDGLYNPADIFIKDVGGIPTAVALDSVGNYVDITTGDVVIPAEITVPGTETDGTIAGFFAKLWEFLQKILSGILAIPGKIVDLIKALLLALFVPDALFWSTNLDKIKGLMWGDNIDNMVDEFKGIGSGSGGQFQDIVVSLMGVDGLSVIDADSINAILDNIHSWVRGVVYPLLVLFNINSLYKMIRGTSLVEATRNMNRMKGGE